MSRKIWALIAVVLIGCAVLVLQAAEPDAKELAQKGYNAFRDVLTGDEAKLPDAIRYMEEARAADETYVPNLFNLARVYFFDGITFGKNESFMKAEKLFARVIELDPKRTDAMSFHGALLAMGSGGKDMAMFMRGAQELKTAFQRTPDDITVRILMAVVAQNVPPQALPMIGLDDPVKNVKIIGGVFDSFSSEFAPHASVVMNTFIAEALMQRGDKAGARASFETALKVPQPEDQGQLAGRRLLDDVIKARMNGAEKPVFENSVFTGCHSCHLAAPEKLLPR